MNELQLQSFVIECLNQGLATLDIVATVQQRYQPNTVGINQNPTIYVQKISDEYVGWMKRTYTANSPTGLMTRNEEQPKITTFQINATAIQNPANTTQLTASDYVEAARYILQSDAALAFLAENDIQVLRITKSRQVQWKDDMRRYEADPSIDCSFVHTLIISSTVFGTTIIVPNVQQVNN